MNENLDGTARLAQPNWVDDPDIVSRLDWLFNTFAQKGSVAELEMKSLDSAAMALLAFIAKPAFGADDLEKFFSDRIDAKTMAQFPVSRLDRFTHKGFGALVDRYSEKLTRALSEERALEGELEHVQRRLERAKQARVDAERLWGALALVKVLRVFSHQAKEVRAQAKQLASAKESQQPDILNQILRSYPEGGTSVFKRIERERTEYMEEIIGKMMRTAQGCIVLREGICQGIELMLKQPDFREYALNKAAIEGL